MDIERSPSKKRNELNEEERLGNVALDYEKQLSLKRQERAEARRLRLSELEKEQREVSILVFFSKETKNYMFIGTSLHLKFKDPLPATTEQAMW